jgi:hypothetical protein
MSIRNFARGLVAASLVAIGCLSASAGVFVQPTLSGTSPSGLQWSAVATGTALPVRTSATSSFNNAAGAVVYFDTTTGQMQIDPKGLDLTTVIITYTTGTTNVTGTNPGPFVYPTGTTTSAFSPTTGIPRTFPAVTAVSGLAPTTFAARVGVTIGAPLGPSLSTTGDVGNIASTSGYFNQPWAFPIELVASGSTATMTISNFKTIGQGSNLNANILGYGSQQSVFQYSANGIVGNQVGAVIPVTAVPEPSTVVLASVGLAVASGLKFRRRLKKQASAVASETLAG